jgi:hypothetical protein
MTSNPEPIVQQRPHEFHNLLTDVTGPDAGSQAVYTVELTRFRRLLALGAVLLRLFLVTRAARHPAEPVTAANGTPLTSHDQRPTTDSSVVGTVCVARPSCTARGQEGRCPLDAELSLPARGYADLLRAWAVYGATDESSRESQTVLARILGVSLRLQAMETGVAAAGPEVTTCDAPPAAPTAPPPVGTIVVVQADGNGVPMVQPSPERPTVRLGKGPKHTTKQEAVVTGLNTMAPDQRPPQAVVEALWPAPDRQEPAPRPIPGGKDVRATLEGQTVAMTRLGARVAPRDGPPIQPRVALTDGAEARPQQLVTHVPAHTLVLDSIHGTEYLWDTATALLGETHPQRLAWVRACLAPLLAGQTDAVITAVEAEGNDPSCTVTPRQAVRRTLGYDQRNRPYRRDDEDLACGWPIGTGVGEGACGHLVKGRLEQAGRRWTQDGAQGVLERRAVRFNDHWEAYGPCHRQPQHQRR